MIYLASFHGAVTFYYTSYIYTLYKMYTQLGLAKYIVKGEKDIKKNHDYTILRQVFDMARDCGDDWVENRFYKGKKIEQVE